MSANDQNSDRHAPLSTSGENDPGVYSRSKNLADLERVLIAIVLVLGLAQCVLNMDLSFRSHHLYRVYRTVHSILEWFIAVPMLLFGAAAIVCVMHLKRWYWWSFVFANATAISAFLTYYLATGPLRTGTKELRDGVSITLRNELLFELGQYFYTFCIVGYALGAIGLLFDVLHRQDIDPPPTDG